MSSPVELIFYCHVNSCFAEAVVAVAPLVPYAKLSVFCGGLLSTNRPVFAGGM
jgi:hypothetical protein